MAHAQVTRFEIDGDERHGGPDGFLRVRRLRLRNRRKDGSLSAPYVCDFVERPKGLDAVVVFLYREREGSLEVLLRRGLRPVLALGRSAERTPIRDRAPYHSFTETVAGIIEREDVGEAGVRKRAAIEVAEEAGYDVAADDVEMLGAGTFPSPGSMPEKFWLTAVSVEVGAVQRPPPGDGSPMEEEASVFWIGLDEAISQCVSGEIEDLKTEVGLRRLREALR